MPSLSAVAGLLRSQQNGADKKEVRISDGNAAGIIGLALLFDGIQFAVLPIFAIPFIGFILALIIPFVVSFTAFVALGFWFAYLKTNIIGGKQAGLKILAAFGAVAIDLLPLISSLPAITFGAVVIIIGTRIEDTVGTKKELLAVARRRQKQQARVDRFSDPEKRKREQQRLDARNRTESGRMAAQYTQGRRQVSPQESATGTEDLGGVLRGEVDAIETKERTQRVKQYDTWNEGQKQRYRMAVARRQYRERLSREAREEGERLEGAGY